MDMFYRPILSYINNHLHGGYVPEYIVLRIEPILIATVSRQTLPCPFNGEGKGVGGIKSTHHLAMSLIGH